MSAINTWGGKTTPELEAEDLHYFCQVIEERAGISLKPSKHDLVRTRLRSRISALSLTSYRDYREYISSISKDDPEWQAFTNMLTTNKTDFFREPRHFDYLVQTILPQWIKREEPVFKVWSSASSTGEEAFTLAMVLDRYLPQDRSFQILASDIDTQVLATAQNSVYSINKKREIPLEYHTTCLDFGKGQAQGYFRIKRRLRSKVIFETHNLMAEAVPQTEAFDLILCRNVLIYFARPSIEFVQQKLFSAVRPGGHLFIGHSESFQGIEHRWKTVGPSVFKKAG